MTALVSVVMAVRNGQRWLNDAIDSILNQTFSDFELLVIDDGSTDNTPEILADYRARDQRVQIVQQAREGLVRALNQGLARASAPLLARLDADDIALPQRLQRQVQYLEQHPQIALLGTWAQEIDQQGKSRGLKWQPPTERNALTATLARTNPFIHSSVMFRTAIARELGGYRAAFASAEDYDLWLRISEVAEIGILPEILVQYRQHGGNVTKTTALRQVFSARLARLASQSRRKAAQDPASTLAGPPDWHVEQADAFYADAARLCRFLELADPAIAVAAAPSSIDVDAVSSRISDLTSAERKLAQSALINLIRRRVRLPGYTGMSLRALLLRLHPTRALGLLWRG